MHYKTLPIFLGSPYVIVKFELNFIWTGGLHRVFGDNLFDSYKFPMLRQYS